MRVAMFVVVVAGLLGIVGAALVDRWEVWPDADWTPPPTQEAQTEWTGTMYLPQAVEPAAAPKELPPPPD